MTIQAKIDLTVDDTGAKRKLHEFQGDVNRMNQNVKSAGGHSSLGKFEHEATQARTATQGLSQSTGGLTTGLTALGPEAAIVAAGVAAVAAAALAAGTVVFEFAKKLTETTQAMADMSGKAENLDRILGQKVGTSFKTTFDVAEKTNASLKATADAVSQIETSGIKSHVAVNQLAATLINLGSAGTAGVQKAGQLQGSLQSLFGQLRAAGEVSATSLASLETSLPGITDEIKKQLGAQKMSNAAWAKVKITQKQLLPALLKISHRYDGMAKSASSFRDRIKSAVEIKLDQFGASLVPYLDTWNKAADDFNEALGQISGKKLSEGIGHALRSIGTALDNAIIRFAFLSGAIEGIQKDIKKFGKLKTAEGLGKRLGISKDTVDGIVYAGKAILLLTDKWNALVGMTLGAGMKLLKGWLIDISLNAKAAFGALGWLVNKFKDIKAVINGKGVLGALKGIVTSLKNLGVDMIKGMWNGIKSEFGNMLKKFGALIHLLPKSVRRILGIHSPSRVMFGLMRHTTMGMERGIDVGRSRVRVSSRRLADAVVDLIKVSLGTVRVNTQAASLRAVSHSSAPARGASEGHIEIRFGDIIGGDADEIAHSVHREIATFFAERASARAGASQ